MPDNNDAMPMVKFEQVTKRYGNLTVLDALDFRVERNERVAIIGPSGSGKSTLLRLLMTLERPDSGDIYVEGEMLYHMQRNGRRVPADKAHIRKVRGKVGMVFQHFNLFPHMTAIENVTEGPIRVLGVKRKEAVRRARELLDMVGLADKYGHRPAQLSGGQKQRVALARSCAMSPSVMLLDEVTSALDPELVGEVLNTIRKIGEDYPVTMLMVTHEMGFAKEFADRVCFFDGGKVVEQGPAREVMANPQSARMKQFLDAVLG